MFLQHGSDFKSFGHDVINHHSFGFSHLKSINEQCIIFRSDGHWFIRKYVFAKLYRFINVGRLLFVISRKDNHISFTVLNKLIQKIIGEMLLKFPGSWILFSGIISYNFILVCLILRTCWCINFHLRTYISVHSFLYQSRMKVTRI